MYYQLNTGKINAPDTSLMAVKRNYYTRSVWKINQKGFNKKYDIIILRVKLNVQVYKNNNTGILR